MPQLHKIHRWFRRDLVPGPLGAARRGYGGDSGAHQLAPRAVDSLQGARPPPLGRQDAAELPEVLGAARWGKGLGLMAMTMAMVIASMSWKIDPMVI